eukprot:7756741-Karenia_brevis.AAC.2
MEPSMPLHVVHINHSGYVNLTQFYANANAYSKEIPRRVLEFRRAWQFLATLDDGTGVGSDFM